MKRLPSDQRHRPLSVVHHEKSFAIVDKLPDFLSVPGRGPESQDFVTERVRELFPHAEGFLAAHRLDMATSGLMVLGLTPQAHKHLSLQFEKRQVDKTYIALLEGQVEADSGHIELPFRVDWPNWPKQMHDPENGKLGITDWRVLERNPDATRVEFTPRTGRTHQLRVHLASLGHPIVGDKLYMGGDDVFVRSVEKQLTDLDREFLQMDRQALHNWKLEILHPESGEPILLEAPLYHDIGEFLVQVKGNA